jgi:hypothetical protein
MTTQTCTQAFKAFSSLQSLSGTLSEVEQDLHHKQKQKGSSKGGGKGAAQDRKPFGQAVNSSRAREAVM